MNNSLRSLPINEQFYEYNFYKAPHKSVFFPGGFVSIDLKFILLLSEIATHQRSDAGVEIYEEIYS